MRLIDADALMKEAGRLWSDMPDGEELSKELMKAINRAPTVGGWISIEDRLPETNDEVLTTYIYDGNLKKRYVEAASYWDDGEGEGHWNSVWDEFRVGNARKEVIAWMPLPRPAEAPHDVP